MYFSSRQESSVTLLAHLSQNFLLKINDRAPLYKYSITGSGVRKERKCMDLLNWHLQKQAGSAASAADVSAVYSRFIFRVILDLNLVLPFDPRLDLRWMVPSSKTLCRSSEKFIRIVDS